ncbi:MAG: STAS domain-containing protein [Gammaproteobacteria bacterium]|nr:STAS domain-containing protein [Gammaproteobacteria bacterium]
MSRYAIQGQGESGAFQVSGELSFATVNDVLAQSRETLFAHPAGQLDLDLGGVNRADSAGLALLIQWMRMARAAHCEIRFHHLPEQLLAIARAGELEGLLPVAG